MEKYLEFADNLKVSDSKIRGIVILKDEDGKIIFKKENMIVETGRTYIRDLVSSALLGTITTPDKIYEIQFGTGSTVTSSLDTTLENELSSYTRNTTSLDWVTQEKTYIGTSGTAVASDGVDGDYYFKTDTLALYLNTATVWDLATPLTANEVFYSTNEEIAYYYDGAVWNLITKALTDEFPTGSLDLYAMLPSNNKVYKYIVSFSITDISGEIGLQASISIIGNDDNSHMISELGLFLAGGDMFSRVVFESFPLHKYTTYNLTYYIYF